MHLELHTIHWFIHIFEKGEFHEAELNNDDGDRCSLLHVQRYGCPKIYNLEENILLLSMITNHKKHLPILEYR